MVAWNADDPRAENGPFKLQWSAFPTNKLVVLSSTYLTQTWVKYFEKDIMMPILFPP
jgi:hypothetical protein